MKKFLIKNYKNIGIEKEVSIDLPEHGGLSVIIGENNAGKSNVLKAIESLGNSYLDKEDYPNYTFYDFSPNEESSLTPTIGYYTDDKVVESKKDSVKTRLPDAKWTRKYEVLETNGLLDSFKDKTYAVCFNKKTMDAMTTYADESAYSIVEELNNLIKEKNSQVFACYIKANGNEYTKIGTISLYFPGISKIYHCKADNTKNREVFECYRVAEGDNFPAGYTQKVVCVPADFTFFEDVNDAINAKLDNALELKTALKTIMPNQSEPEYESKDEQKGNCLIELSLKDGNISLRSDDEQSLEAIEIFNNYFSNLWESLGKLDNNILSREYYSMLKNKDEIVNLIKNKYDNFIKDYNLAHFDDFLENIKSKSSYLSSIFKNVKVSLDDRIRIPNIKNLIPRITYYDNKDIVDSDLKTKPDELDKNSFFCNFFNKIGISSEKIKKAYEKHSERSKNSSSNILIVAKNEVDKKIMENLTEPFNELYYGKNLGTRYNFSISLEEDSIQLIITKDGDPLALALKEQSVGFRKFFSMFFKFVYQGSFGIGDVILIDEIETHLSIPVQRELRSFLKSFGERNGINFIVTTHSNYILDVRHLDEVKIVKPCADGKGSTVINDFSAIADNEADTLAEIKRSLGVGAISLLDRRDRPIFVEGITDYAYLTAMYSIYKNIKRDVPKLLFLPICGLGRFDKTTFDPKVIKPTSDQKAIKASLLSLAKAIKEEDAFLLVDGDRAGSAMAELAKNDDNFTVFELKEVPALSKMKDIEDLFSQESYENYNMKTKSHIVASTFKSDVRLGRYNPTVSERNNFFALFDYLVTFCGKSDKKDIEIEDVEIAFNPETGKSYPLFGFRPASGLFY
jgi:hypothetical protein